MNPRFNHKVAVVTGAAQGIGRRVVERLLDEGARVTAVDRSELVHELRSLPGAADQLLTLTADLERNADAERVMAEAVQRFGRIDILVNNVGGTSLASTSRSTYREHEIVAEVRRRLSRRCGAATPRCPSCCSTAAGHRQRFVHRHPRRQPSA